MPKKSEATGATYMGHEGIVADARDQLWEVDPSRKLDGTVQDGFESDERDISNPDHPREDAAPSDDLALSEDDDLGQEKARAEKDEASDARDLSAEKKDEEKGEKSSPGNSLSASKTTPALSTQKSASNKK